MANKFVYVEYDKFTNRRESYMSPMTLDYDDDDFYISEGTFCINLRHVSSPESEGLVLDVRFNGEDWFFLRSGKLIININGVENIALEPHESYAKVVDKPFSRHETECEESDWYEIDKDLLKKICDAKSIDFQIRGEGVEEFNGNKFIKYAQVFYNGFYDEEAYKEVLDEKLDYICSDDDDDEEGDDSTSNSSGSGCMVTLLLMCSALSSIAACLFFVMRLF